MPAAESREAREGENVSLRDGDGGCRPANYGTPH